MKPSGFTLVEVLAVVVLLGILSAVAVPRLSFGPGIEQRLDAERLVALLRLAQLRAMNDPDAFNSGQPLAQCGRLVLTTTRFGIADNCDDALADSYPQQGPLLGINQSQAISATESLPFIIQFGTTASGGLLSEEAWLGRPYIEQAGSLVRVTSPVDISLGGVTVRIEPEGYVHDLP
ncbi:prepilin-type N-terminal cleavage/methylation domain-containing protein [Zobellella maritima]|uniref:prepilin-type N-terminal cleavage/methylation domain-containing protein n=1 Tax=Zobellella maritima TaxID=2059725 RepID=UPI0013002F09|nr:prepilin-type N-terminal cleavage/methylation domain-containing protein [Zobellella maritima]